MWSSFATQIWIVSEVKFYVGVQDKALKWTFFLHININDGWLKGNHNVLTKMSFLENIGHEIKIIYWLAPEWNRIGQENEKIWGAW